MQAINALNFHEQNRLNRQRESNEIQSNSILNACYESIVAVILIVLIIFNDGTRWGKGIKEIIMTSIGIRLGFLAPVSFVFHYLVKHRKINPSIVGMINSLIGLPFLGWYIFITVHFFKGTGGWEKVKMLYIAYIVLLLESIFYYIRLLFVIAVVIIVVTYWGIHHSLSKTAKKPLKIKQILLGIANLKMKRNFYEPDDVWSIWVERFEPSMNIIRLPWNEKHYFHDVWIGEWVNNNPNCPLCKFTITEEILHAFAESPEMIRSNQNEEVEMQRGL